MVINYATIIIFFNDIWVVHIIWKYIHKYLCISTCVILTACTTLEDLCGSASYGNLSAISFTPYSTVREDFPLISSFFSSSLNIAKGIKSFSHFYSPLLFVLIIWRKPSLRPFVNLSSLNEICYLRIQIISVQGKTSQLFFPSSS